MDTFQLLASAYELGLGCGIWSKKEVILWCDRVIETKERPPYEIIEVSLMSQAKLDDIQGKLSEISKEADKEYTVKLLLSVILEKLKINQLSLDEAIKCSTRLVVQAGLSYEDEYFNLYHLDDSYDLAQQSIHFDLTNVVEAFKVELGAYSKYFNEFQKVYLLEMNREWVR